MSNEDELQQRLDKVYQSRIAPQVPALEGARRQRLRSAYIRYLSCIGAIALITVAVYLLGWWSSHTAIVVAVLTVLAGATFYWATRPAARQRSEIRNLVIGPICELAGGLTYRRRARRAFDATPFRKLGVVGPYTAKHLEDLFTGHYRGTDFSMVEARLSQRFSRYRRSVFDGLLFDIAVPQDFSCKVVLVNDKGDILNRVHAFLRKRFGDMELIAFDDAAFEKHFEVFSDDVQGAHALLTPGFLDNMTALVERSGGKALTAAFADGRFLLALPYRRDLFEIGKLHRSLDHLQDDLRNLLRQVTTPHRLIDFLHGDRPKELVE